MIQPKSFIMNIQNYLQCFISHLQIKRYSPTSIKNYQSNLLLFLTVEAHKYSTATEIEIAAIEKYFHLKIKKDSMSDSHHRIILASITKFYELVLEKNINLKHLYPQRKDYKLTNYLLSTAEIKKLIEVTYNLKHKSIIILLYLCLSEVVNLKITDIDSKAMTIYIRQVNAKKYRQVMLSKNFLLILRHYYLKFKPTIFLSEGQNGLQYSAKSIRQIVKQNAAKSGINKSVSPHILGHCYATHLIEVGTKIHYIQELLGHSHLNTTKIYTQ